MGASRAIGVAAVLAAAAFPGSRASGATEWEPVARLSLEGGYDSNALYLGRGGDQTAKVSPEVGLKLRNPRWDVLGVYGADYLRYQRLAPGGNWNHRGIFHLDAEPTRRLKLDADAKGGLAYDPVGLAAMGIFRTGQVSAWTLSGRARAEYEVAPRLAGALTLREQVVMFQDRTGGAMHAPGAELLWAEDRRLALGVAYALGLFQGFEANRTDLAVSNGVRARARYRVSRELLANAFVGPAMWSGPGQALAFVPEAGVELGWATRAWDLRGTAQHALGLGSTARPGLVDSFEIAGVRRFGRRFDVKGDAGLWRSGLIPTGKDATLGYALGGEAGTTFGRGLRLALVGTHYARLDVGSSALSRSTIGLRLGWTWDAR